MHVFKNCKTYHTGLSNPHTICINSHNVSIVHVNQLNEKATKDYYVKTKKMIPYAIAIDTYNETYTIYTENVNNPFLSIIAIPDKPIERGIY